MNGIEKEIERFIMKMLNKQPNITYEELHREFQKGAKRLCDKGVLIPGQDISKLHDLPLEWEVIKIFKRFVELDSRKAWSKVILPDGKEKYTYDFLIKRGFYIDDHDTIEDVPFIYLVFEVKSHMNNGASIEDLRQLEDWVGRLNRTHQQNLTEDMLKRLIKAIPAVDPVPIDMSGQIPLSETTKLLPILNPYKGVFIINHEWGRDNKGTAFGENEKRFAKERGFSLINFEDLLIFKKAIEDYEIDAWFFLEELWLTDGIFDLHSFPGFNLDKKYRKK
jgi:hypothetical protein